MTQTIAGPAKIGASSSMASLRKDTEVMREIEELLGSSNEFPRAMHLDRGKRAIIEMLEGKEPEFGTEAIVLATGRPSLLIKNGSFEKPDLKVWQKRLDPLRATIDGVIPSVGRIELRNHPGFDWVGTGWLIENEILITNRHVANEFAEQEGNRFVFQANLFGEAITARVDFREEHLNPESFEIEVEEIVYVAPSGRSHPDMAVLKVRPHFERELPNPMVLADTDPEDEQRIGVIGYPARDSRNGLVEMDRIFKDIYDVKRFAPGEVMSVGASGQPFRHDCTTLGGNSGSPVIDLVSGKVVGLHFAGRFQQANHAVPVSTIKQVLARGGSVVGRPDLEFDEDEERPISHYDDRRGYDEEFLGSSGEALVPLPTLSPGLRDEAFRVKPDARGMNAYALDYTHFSVVMSKTTKLALYTAVNIDGTSEVLLNRRNTRWKIDPRLPREFQTGNELYRHNKLDRGHLVRRLDPVWGPTDIARQADDDSFHYTNSAPQHARLNQREWLKLEDHLLRLTHRKNLKLTVFTGPINDASDQTYRGASIPQEFWKVIAMIGPDDQLHATGYVLSQTEFLDDIEFRFGQFRTYQTAINVIERRTGISFGRLADVDPLAQRESLPYVAIEGVTDIVV